MAQCYESWMIETRRLSAYALIHHDDHLLLSKLNRGPHSGKWNLVGGSIEHGESPEQALLREIREEAGLNVDATPILLDVLSENQIFENTEGIQENFHLIGVIYSLKLELRAREFASADGESSDGCQWFPIQEIQNLKVVPFVTEALKRISQ
jgi:8-oxo-dGTP diphosphatase